MRKGRDRGEKTQGKEQLNCLSSLNHLQARDEAKKLLVVKMGEKQEQESQD